ARTIAWDGTPKVLAATRRFLKDPSGRIRIAAIDALADAKDQDSRAAIRSQFKGEKDADVRRAVAMALGKLGGRGALDMLIAAFRDPHTEEPVRTASLEAVEQIGSDRAVKALGDLIAQKSLSSVEIQTRAIEALGRFHDRAAIPALLGTLKSPRPAVRASAIDALVVIVEGRAPAAGRFRRRRGNQPAPPPTVPPEVARAVRALLTDRDVSGRRRAIAAVAALKDREAIPALMAAADAPDSRFEAAMALAAVPDIRALHVYLRGLADRSTDLRNASGTAIANIRDKA